MNTLIHDIHVIPMKEETVLQNQHVVLHDGVISSITSDIPSGNFDNVIDGTGKYLIPGLWDCHAHWEGTYMSHLDLFVAFGVTSLRVMWGNDACLKARAEDAPLHPRMILCGEIIDGDPPVWPTSLIVKTQEEARQAVMSTKERGFDFVKIYNNIPLELFDTIMATAREVGIEVLGHIPRAVGPRYAIEAGQYCIEHAKALPADMLEHAARAGVYFCPTLVTQEYIEKLKTTGYSDEDWNGELTRYASSAELAEWRSACEFFLPYDFRLDRPFNKYVTDMKVYHDAGGTLLCGTDTPVPFVVPGLSIHRELELLKQSGLRNFEVLKTATVNASKACRQPQTGTVEVGKNADLLILDANPLECISNSRRIAGVIIKGNYLNRETLDNLLAEAHAAAGN